LNFGFQLLQLSVLFALQFNLQAPQQLDTHLAGGLTEHLKFPTLENCLELAQFEIGSALNFPFVGDIVINFENQFILNQIRGIPDAFLLELFVRVHVLISK
jgi:hypothetical protein